MQSLIILTDWFPPAYKAGGPARSTSQLALALSPHLPGEVTVLTGAFDHGEKTVLPGVKPDTPTEYGHKVKVWYLSQRGQGFFKLLHHLKKDGPAVYYLNSMFSPVFTLIPLLAYRFGWITGRIILAPRGMLKPSALQFKAGKKKLFLDAFRKLGLDRRIIFHASSPEEAGDILAAFGAEVRVVTCPSLPEVQLLEKRMPKEKPTASVRFCFTGRIHPIKNLDVALSLLSAIHDVNAQVDVIGPVENQDYADKCQAIASSLPSNISVKFHGEQPPPQMIEILQQADFFLLLTQGENFGHAIFEALALGKPVIISDQTPWRDLEKNQAGWDLALQNQNAIREVLQRAATMNALSYRAWSDGAFLMARHYVEESDGVGQYYRMFFPQEKG